MNFFVDFDILNGFNCLGGMLIKQIWYKDDGSNIQYSFYKPSCVALYTVLAVETENKPSWIAELKHSWTKEELSGLEIAQ